MIILVFLLFYFVISGLIAFGLTMLKAKYDSYLTITTYGYNDYSTVVFCSIFWIAAPVYVGYLLARIYRLKH